MQFDFSLTINHFLPCKNDFRSFKLNQVFNLDNDNGAEETPTLIDRKVLELPIPCASPIKFLFSQTSPVQY